MHTLERQPPNHTKIILVPKVTGLRNIVESSPQILICQCQIEQIKQGVSCSAYKALYSRSLTVTLHHKAVMSLIVSLKYYFLLCILRMISYPVLFICLYLAQLFHYWCQDAIQNLMINFHVNLSCLNNWWERWAQAFGVSNCYSFCLFWSLQQSSPSSPLENTPLGGNGLNYPALYHSRWGITLIQISALSSKIYTFILPPIWLSSWICIKSSIFCIMRSLGSHRQLILQLASLAKCLSKIDHI